MESPESDDDTVFFLEASDSQHMGWSRKRSDAVLCAAASKQFGGERKRRAKMVNMNHWRIEGEDHVSVVSLNSFSQDWNFSK